MINYDFLFALDLVERGNNAKATNMGVENYGILFRAAQR